MTTKHYIVQEVYWEVPMLAFVPVDDFSSVNPVIEMKWSGLNIDGADQIRPEMCLFQVKTFASFTREENNGPGMAYGPVNDFLTTVSTHIQEQIVFAFLQMQMIIEDGQPDASDIIDVEDNLGEVIDNLDKATNLFDLIEEYIRKGNIPISDMSDAGTRIQDSIEMTFVEDEAITITTIAVLMKLLSPIIGVFIAKYTHVIDNEFKEGHAQCIMTKFFSRKCKVIIERLDFYINRLIEGKLKNNPTTVWNGRTLDRSTRVTMDTIITKRFVGVDLYRKDGNIVKYIASCCRSSAEPHISAANAVKIISDPVDLEKKDEGNTSRIEAESRQTETTADVPILIRVAANRLWQTVIEKEELDRDVVEAAIAFYKRNPVTINPISVYLLSSYFGPDLGGGESIFHLNNQLMSCLTAVLQVLSIKNGASYICHILTANCSVDNRANVPSDFVFVNSWRSTGAYVECKKVFPSGFGEKEWDSKLKQISQYLIQKNIYYATAPSIWDYAQLEMQNGKLFTDYLNLMTEIMQFVRVLFRNRSMEL